MEMMKDEFVESIRKLILQESQVASANWRDLALVIELRQGGQSGYGFLYHDDGSANSFAPSAGSSPVYQEVRNLQIAMHEENNADWKVCIAKMSRESGRFSIDFEYDDAEKWKMRPATLAALKDALRPKKI